MKKMLLIGRTIDHILNDIPHQVDIVHITKKNELNYGTNVFLRPVMTIVMDYSIIKELEKVATFLNEIHNFDAVYSFSEEGLYPASHISEFLKIPGLNKESVLKSQNKLLMRELLSEHPKINLDFKKITATEDLVAFLEKNNKVILKPISSYGSKGVIQINSIHQIEVALNHCKDFSDEIIAEQYYDGNHISIETFSLDGNHYILAVTDKTMCAPPYNVSLNQLMPSRLNNEIQVKIHETANTLLNLIGIKFGPSHIEMVVHRDEVKIVEIQTRPGGRIHEMLKLGLGINIFELTVNNLLFKKELPQVQSGAVALHYLIPNQNGILKEIRGLKKIERHPNVKQISINKRPGEVITDLKNTSGRIGHILIKADNSDEAFKLGEKLIKEIEIELE